MDDPTLGGGGYSGFPAGATRSGAGENFGNYTNGVSLQRTGDGTTTFFSASPTPSSTNICFANGTRLLTPSGQRKVEDLSVSDLVLTSGGTPEPIRWVFAKTWQTRDTEILHNLRPACIFQVALGPNLPARDLRISQQHRILVQGAIAKRMFGVKEMLVPSITFLPLPGIYVEK